MPSPRAPGRPRRRATPVATTQRVLDVAERLAQTRGFNGFSYADVAAEVGITTASLHYHFPTKADLGVALLRRYEAAFEAALEAIDAARASARERLARYARLYQDVLDRGRLCLCGMLAAEVATLPAPMQRALRAFFDRNEAWLAGVLEAGRDGGDLAFAGEPRDAARHWVSTLEGAMLLARSYGEPGRLSAVARRLVAAYAGR